MSEFLTVRINSPERVIWEGKAKSVSSVNSQGRFDILPQHANFISLIENKPIKIKTEEREIEFNFERSVIYTQDNQVHIYTHI